MDNWKHEEEKVVRMFGSDEEVGNQIPTQAQTIVEGSGAVLISEFKPVADVDYLQICPWYESCAHHFHMPAGRMWQKLGWKFLGWWVGPMCCPTLGKVQGWGQGWGSRHPTAPTPLPFLELLAIQQQGPRSIGFFGTRNMGFMHQELIEILSYAMVITKNHIYTSGAAGTNAAVIRGALRAERPELLTVILPQSLKKQPPESQELLSKVKNVIEKPHNDHLPLLEASRVRPIGESRLPARWKFLQLLKQMLSYQS
uniref:Uncharacterized protein n=1 Tax=Fagus sylvatica TaxID=28930 RepID=A0A2N9IIU8_FAGSY